MNANLKKSLYAGLAFGLFIGLFFGAQTSWLEGIVSMLFSGGLFTLFLYQLYFKHLGS